VRKNILAALIALALSSAPALAAKYTSDPVPLTSGAWVDLGVGPIALEVRSGFIFYVVADEAPSVAVIGHILGQSAQQTSMDIGTDKRVFARAVDGTASVVTSPIAAAAGGGGGGAVTIADGSDIATGARADAAWVSGSGSVISILKSIKGGVPLSAALPAGTNYIGNVRPTDGTNFMPTGDVAFRPIFVRPTDGTNTAAMMDVAARAGFQRLTDGTNNVAVKAASTAPAAADPALVASISPNGRQVSGSIFKHVLSTTLTRIANTTAYTASVASPQAICLFTSGTVCAPPTITVSSDAAVTGTVAGLRLIKSSTGATGATFAILLYQATPTVTSVFDATTYTPRIADITTNRLIGAFTCNNQVVNVDNSTYECASTAGNGLPNFNGITLTAMILTTGAYAPASGETFSVQADLVTNVP
jgi:hypothetical protein